MRERPPRKNRELKVVIGILIGRCWHAVLRMRIYIIDLSSVLMLLECLALRRRFLAFFSAVKFDFLSYRRYNVKEAEF